MPARTKRSSGWRCATMRERIDERGQILVRASRAHGQHVRRAVETGQRGGQLPYRASREVVSRIGYPVCLARCLRERALDVGRRERRRRDDRVCHAHRTLVEAAIHVALRGRRHRLRLHERREVVERHDERLAARQRRWEVQAVRDVGPHAAGEVAERHHAGRLERVSCREDRADVVAFDHRFVALRREQHQLEVVSAGECANQAGRVAANAGPASHAAIEKCEHQRSVPFAAPERRPASFRPHRP